MFSGRRVCGKPARARILQVLVQRVVKDEAQMPVTWNVRRRRFGSAAGFEPTTLSLDVRMG